MDRAVRVAGGPGVVRTLRQRPGRLVDGHPRRPRPDRAGRRGRARCTRCIRWRRGRRTPAGRVDQRVALAGAGRARPRRGDHQSRLLDVDRRVRVPGTGRLAARRRVPGCRAAPPVPVAGRPPDRRDRRRQPRDGQRRSGRATAPGRRRGVPRRGRRTGTAYRGLAGWSVPGRPGDPRR